MLATPLSNHPASLISIEFGLTALAAVVAFGWPKLGRSVFSRIERALTPLARRKVLSVVLVGVSAFVLRLALIPLCPIPHPFTPDDFSFLLSADTFAHGRMANPTPAMWVNFESIHITMKPTYVTMYFPAQGLIMAAGKVVFGNPWFGILIISALMCASICWMLQAWLPPTWALLGGALAILRLGLFSYFINTYTGAGSVSALGGALVLGALPRIMRKTRLQDGMLMAIGIVLLAMARPYEGLLLCGPVAVALGHWALFSKKRPPYAVLMRHAALPLLVIVGAGAWLGYYDYRAFGSPATLPYKVDRTTYATAPYYVWQPPRPQPVYHNAQMRQFYLRQEMKLYVEIHKASGYLPKTISKIHNGLLFLTGIALVPPLLMSRRVLLDKRVRFLVICVSCLVAGLAIEIYLIPHYMAPFMAAFYALGLQAMRHLRLWRPERRPVGLTMVRLIVTVCFGLAGLRLASGPLHLTPAEWPPNDWLWEWYGPGNYGTARAQVAADLEKMPGKQLVIVRYSADHYPLDEWVYNDADLDTSKVIWAREIDPAQDGDLIRYYKDRNAWLVEPDAPASTSTPENLRVKPVRLTDASEANLHTAFSAAAAAGIFHEAKQ